MSYTQPDQQHHRACAQCRGEGWLTGPEHNGWPTITPCPECRPATAALHTAGAYRPDEPSTTHSTKFQQIATQADTGRPPRTALWSWPQLLAEWPPPGQRTTTPSTRTAQP